MDRRFVATMTEKHKTSTKFPKTDSSILFPRYTVTIEKEKLSSKNWKKPKDMPRRPLSAYNLFFKSERGRLIASIHEECTTEIRKGKSVGIGFAGLAREIAKKWKSLDKSERSLYEREAETEKQRYTNEISVWKKSQKEQTRTKALVDSHVTSMTTDVFENHETGSSNMIRNSFDASDRTSQSLRDILFETKIREYHDSDQKFHQELWAVPNLCSLQSPSDMSQLPHITVENLSMMYLESVIRQQFSTALSTTSFSTSSEPKDDLENFMENMEKGLS